ncbi:UNVERIFIED_CONTAM: hypothetical protein GTU68_015451 [Idotea baltica]|nr:hypothetical protein [Idotea baltica]
MNPLLVFISMTFINCFMP